MAQVKRYLSTSEQPFGKTTENSSKSPIHDLQKPPDLFLKFYLEELMHIYIYIFYLKKYNSN
jgi:hypothetical protein